MSGSETSFEALERSVTRLAAAIGLIERAAERRMRHDETRAEAEEELALMQDDRSRLAVELDAALDRMRGLETANSEAGDRLARAAQTIARVIERMEPSPEPSPNG